MNEWQRMGFGQAGVSYAVSESIGQAMARSVPVVRVAAPSPPELTLQSSLTRTVAREEPGRDARGRILASPPVPEQADEQISGEQVRSRLRTLLGQLPGGSLSGLARLCGFRSYPRQSLRAIAKGRGKLMEASRRRISRVLNQLERGELVCVATGKRWGGYPVYVWEQRKRPGTAPASINSRQEVHPFCAPDDT